MKEKYVKPQMLFENFSLSQTIAKDCGDTHDSTLGRSNHYDAYTCNWVIDGDTEEETTYLFFVDACADSWMIGDPEPGDELPEGMCYNNPEGGQMVFSST